MVLPFKTRYRQTKNVFAKIVPWAYISDWAEGVVVQKSGLMQRTFVYRGPDLESASPVYINDMSIFINDIVKRLGNGWAFHFETQHYETRDYPGTAFTNEAAFLVDKEREKMYQSYGAHYDSSYYITIIYEPPLEIAHKVSNIFFKEKEVGFSQSIKEALNKFISVTSDIYQLLSKQMTICVLNNTETLSYLHSSISHNRHPFSYPDGSADAPLEPFFLDHVLPDSILDVGMTLKLGEYFTPIIDIKAFPSKTYPAILDALNAANIEYRWTSRFICMDKTAAIAAIQKQSDKFFGQREGWKQTLWKMWTNEDTGRINAAAVHRGHETDAAEIDIETDTVSLGYYTSSLMVWDKSLKKAKEKMSVLKSIINAAGFVCIDETFNAMESFKSMMPGNVYPNIRRTALTSLNFAHVIPISAIWTGNSHNSFTESLCGVAVPLMVCSSNYRTPFYFNLNVGDVGMAFVVGPIGAGKSTFLQMLEIQFLKYPSAQVILLDIGKSARQLTMAVGGKYYEPGTSRIAFQPLAQLETQEDILWAAEYIESMLILQNQKITPTKSKAIYAAMLLMAEMPVNQRTLTTFRQTVSYFDEDTKTDTIKESLEAYCLGGKYGVIFDSDQTNIGLDTQWLMIEMESLVKLGEGCVVPALQYIFHLIEQKFDGTLTLLVVDEVFRFFKIPIFAEQFHSWIKQVRKKNVFIVLATQEIADIIKSPLCSTLVEECLTKIFLANKEASTPVIFDYYKQLGLTDSQIEIISHATMKRDYFYKSPLGTRMFQLDLGEIALGLLGGQNHEALDELEKEGAHEPNYPFVLDILYQKKISYEEYYQ